MNNEVCYFAFRSVRASNGLSYSFVLGLESNLIDLIVVSEDEVC